MLTLQNIKNNHEKTINNNLDVTDCDFKFRKQQR